MGTTDSIPVISQLKSLVEVCCGNTVGARRTQINFSNQCIVVSQVKSLVQSLGGDNVGARQTQEIYLNNAVQTINGIANGTPGVGHLKGSLHYIRGEKEAGDQAMKSASRTIGVIGGGVSGMIIGGPIGAVAGGIAGGAVMDGITTGQKPAKINQKISNQAQRNPKIGSRASHQNGSLQPKIRARIDPSNILPESLESLTADGQIDLQRVYESMKHAKTEYLDIGSAVEVNNQFDLQSAIPNVSDLDGIIRNSSNAHTNLMVTNTVQI
ncbi:UNKNOWN [Stylonychia lemnae]|uniref:Glycine zipper domain-containing protein n=1 Tax=Stylonychia lemnae TaxID=5949 RepID=A0A077ZXT3_STYLE|nr:UNKNOWN [Stylonychia lemnae]|eukprot:CDW74392.1 UNKNOWN [Stylonychia lemnae]